MKILITTDWYSPVINGVVTSILNLKSGLEKMGHEVRVLTLSGSVHSYEENSVTYIGSVGVGMIYPNARLRIALSHSYIRKLIEWRPDVVHSQCEFSTYFMAKKIARLSGAPLVHTYHTVYEDYTHYFSPNKRIGRAAVAAFSRKILKSTEYVIAPTDKVKVMLERYNVKPPVVTVPSGLNLIKFERKISEAERNSLRAKIGISNDNIVLLYLGRLAKEKNIEELFRLLNGFPDSNIRLLIVGDGPHREKLEKLNTDSRVVFTGMVPPDKVSKYYQIGDVFVSASQSETQGLTYIEAMASGLPLLCKKDECLAGVITGGQTGFEYEKSEDFCSQLSKLKDCFDYRKQIGFAAAKFARQHYSYDAFAGAVYVIYSSAILKKEQSDYAKSSNIAYANE